MARQRVRLNSRGIARILKAPEMHRVVNAAADAVKANVEAQSIGVGDKDGGKHEIPLPVKVTPGTSDRARASVLLAHPAGAAVQAKHGALTKAAAQAGLDVNERKS